MKIRHLLIVIASLAVYTNTKGQSTIETDSFFSEGLQSNILVNIYLPEGYDQRSGSYPLYIFLHDCCGADHTSFNDTMKLTLDQKIKDSEIEPLIVVWPNVSQGPFNNLHLFADSPASGPFASVITDELMPWLIEHSQYNVSQSSCQRVIGGIGMGADGATRIGIRNPDLFSAFIAHNGGGGLALRGFEDLLPGVLFESPQAAPAYTFNPINGATTAQFFAAAVAFSPNLDNPPHHADFIINSDGKIDSSIMYEQWIPNHNPSTLLAKLKIDPNYEPIGAYFDHGTLGSIIQFVSKPFSTRFAKELDSIGFEYTYLEIPGDYEVTSASFGSGLDWFNSRLCMTSTPVTTSNETMVVEAISPNPSRGGIILSLNTTETTKIQLRLLDITGGELYTEGVTTLVSGQHEIQRDFSHISPGTYFLSLGNNSKTCKKIVLVGK